MNCYEPVSLTVFLFLCRCKWEVSTLRIKVAPITSNIILTEFTIITCSSLDLLCIFLMLISFLFFPICSTGGLTFFVCWFYDDYLHFDIRARMWDAKLESWWYFDLIFCFCISRNIEWSHCWHCCSRSSWDADIGSLYIFWILSKEEGEGGNVAHSIPRPISSSWAW